MRIIRPSTSSMTASIIGWEALSSDRSRQVSSQCSIQGRRPVGTVAAWTDDMREGEAITVMDPFIGGKWPDLDVSASSGKSSP